MTIREATAEDWPALPRVGLVAKPGRLAAVAFRPAAGTRLATLPRPRGGMLS